MKKLLLIISGAIFTLTACSSGGSNGSSSNISYTTLPGYNLAESGSSTIVTGIRGITNSASVYISGLYGTANGTTNGAIYAGPINESGGTWYILNYPSSIAGESVTGTAWYGPNNGEVAGTIQIVGNYTVESNIFAQGILYSGALDGSGTWTKLQPPSPDVSAVKNTIAHSNMGGIVVGNYDTHLATGKAFIYNIHTGDYTNLELPVQPREISVTAYGIWANGGESYTIVGGYDNGTTGLTNGYILDWNKATGAISHFTTLYYNNESATSIVSHVEGITSNGNGGYNLAADTSNGSGGGAAYVQVARNSDGSFATPVWTMLTYPGASVMSANTVYENNVLGVYELPNNSQVYSYLATINQ